ncbi:LysE family translocator [Salinithrix halophila]|uniref:LysE family translocator n=1 Tax=Salinithrix halophila TaxID=1485204 RepID=A0ABV8JEV6_9BACL
MDVDVILSFLAVSVLLTIIPGPDNLFVIAQSIGHGRKAGVVTALSLCSGVLVHTMAAALGISAILVRSSFAFQLVKYAGAAYLLYLAWQAWKERDAVLSAENQPLESAGSLIRKGILMNVLNPKVSLFFLAFLPQFVSPGTDGAALQMVGLGVLFMVQAAVIFTLFALFAGSLGEWLKKRPQTGRLIHLGKAVLFAFIGIRLAFSGK